MSRLLSAAELSAPVSQLPPAAYFDEALLARERELLFARGPGYPELNLDNATLDAIHNGLSAFRQGAGPEMGILLDTNFNFKTEGYIKVARACEPYNLFWMEIDSYDPEGLRLIRSDGTDSVFDRGLYDSLRAPVPRDEPAAGAAPPAQAQKKRRPSPSLFVSHQLSVRFRHSSSCSSSNFSFLFSSTSVS